jgi:hypothetical protein
MKRVLIFAMGRSGHHAIINWIAKNHTGRVEHHNHCCLDWDKGEINPWKGRVDIYNETLLGEEMIIKNIEDFDMDDFSIISDFDFVKRSSIYVVVRDHYNWIASSFKVGGYARDKMNTNFKDQRGSLKESRKAMWIKQMESCLSDDMFGNINYNSWVLDKTYRDNLCDDIGIDKGDNGLLDMSTYCNGSSFDKGNDVKGMDLMNRWKVFDNDKEYTDIVKEGKMVKLTKSFFNYK